MSTFLLISFVPFSAFLQIYYPLIIKMSLEGRLSVSFQFGFQNMKWPFKVLFIMKSLSLFITLIFK